MPERHPSRQTYRLADMARTAQMADMPIHVKPRHWPTNPVPASTAIINAGAAGGDVGLLVRVLLRKCWADEADIAQDDVVQSALEEAGFDPALAGANMLGAVETYEKNTQDALDAGVFGAPSYVLAGEVFWGQDRLGQLDRRLAG